MEPKQKKMREVAMYVDYFRKPIPFPYFAVALCQDECDGVSTSLFLLRIVGQP